MKIEITMDDGFQFKDEVVSENLYELSKKILNQKIGYCVLDKHAIRVKEIKRIKVIDE